jgi:hypothetical protein
VREENPPPSPFYKGGCKGVLDETDEIDEKDQFLGGER